MNSSPKKLRMSRETLLPALAAHVLEHGMEHASLRPLAKAAGTSDRMLIYHFGSKEQLVDDVLDYIAETYAKLLDAAFAAKPAKSREEVLARVLDSTGDDAMKPFLALWWQIVAGCARGNAGYLSAAQSVMDTLLAWLERQMPADDPDPASGARYLLTLIEGTQMLEAIGRGGIAADGLKSQKLG
ncbi:TetR/AcrR family transcriptional regulator [Altererythrobacter sp. MF3-039]|uniref:TetR/AcrR family transcriptional regulator n=1 Tax=Altererythrobacter sp. MF3-039 TaxID=3252901 RepID=UPI00390CB66B